MCSAFPSWQQSSPMNGSSTISSNTDMPHQSHSRPYHPCDTTHHIGVKYVDHAHTENLVQNLKSLCTISTEWEDEFYCGLTLSYSRLAICYHTAFPIDPEPARQLRPNSCHRAFVLHPSNCCLRVLSIYPYFHSLGRYWDPR
jgi:hypothetical protein